MKHTSKFIDQTLFIKVSSNFSNFFFTFPHLANKNPKTSEGKRYFEKKYTPEQKHEAPLT